MRNFLAASACSFLALPAFAGGPAAPVYEPPVTVVQVIPASFNWGGGYVGGQIGYGIFTTDSAVLGDPDGMIGGVHAGYNWDMGDYVWGIEADIDAVDENFDNGAGDINNTARLKLRFGRDLGRTLVYGTVGGVRVDGDVGGRSQKDIGWLAGGGVDYALTDHWILGGEALYNSISNFDNTNADLEEVSLRAKISYKF